MNKNEKLLKTQTSPKTLLPTRHPNMNGSGDDSPSSGQNNPDDVNKTGISNIPEEILERIFADLKIQDIRNARLVCKEWSWGVGDMVWRSHCLKRMAVDEIHSKLVSPCTSYYAVLRAHMHAWNPLDSSNNVFVRMNGFTLHRIDAYYTSDGARGKVGFDWGRHAWEVTWHGPLGSASVVGVATIAAQMKKDRYIPLIGSDDQSWGWNLADNMLVHRGSSYWKYPSTDEAANKIPPKYKVGEKIRVILDCEKGNLSFEKNGVSLGIAFYQLPRGVKLYPAVSTVYGHTEVSMIYLGPVNSE